MNKVLLIGNLTRDPDCKVMQNGKLRAMYTIAVSRPYTDANGQRAADYISCVAYDKTAELIQKYLAKGRKVGVEGRIRTGKYEKDGQTIYTTEILTEHVDFLSPSQQAQASTDTQETDAATPANAGANFPEGFTVVDDDDLPF